MTIYEIQIATKDTSPYFFSEDTLHFFGQTMESFSVLEQNDGRFLIRAKSFDCYGTFLGYTKRYYNLVSNELERE